MYMWHVALDEELKRMGMSSELANFFRYLFVVDQEKRPSAEEALRSSELEALNMAQACSGGRITDGRPGDDYLLLQAISTVCVAQGSP